MEVFCHFHSIVPWEFNCSLIYNFTCPDKQTNMYSIGESMIVKFFWFLQLLKGGGPKTTMRALHYVNSSLAYGTLPCRATIC